MRVQGVRIIVTLECTESKGEGATPSRYCSQKVRAQGHSTGVAAA